MNMREETRSTTGLTGRGQQDAQGTRAALRQVRKGNDDHHTRQHVADSDGSISCLDYPVRHAMVSGPVYTRALCAQPRSNDGSLSQTARITRTGKLVFPPNELHHVVSDHTLDFPQKPGFIPNHGLH